MKSIRLMLLFITVAVGAVHPAEAVPINLALGADTSASDPGWGGGNSKSDLVDGLASYSDTWAHGLAAPWSASGDFHVVIDFGSATTFNTVIPYWHGAPSYAANVIDVQIWNSVTSMWENVFSINNALSILGPPDDPTTWTSNPTALSFSAVTSDKLMLVYDNTEIYNRSRLHGWLYEVDVFNNSVPEPTTLALVAVGLAGVFRWGRRKQAS